MAEWKRVYLYEERSCITFVQTDVLTIFYKMKNSRNKTNILFSRQRIEEDDLTKALTSTGNVFK